MLASKKTKALRTIAQGGYDFVVLQEDVPETTVAKFESAAIALCSEIWAAGATPVLLMMWPYARLGSTTLLDIAAAHRSVAARVNASRSCPTDTDTGAGAGESGGGDAVLPAVRVAPVAIALHALRSDPGFTLDLLGEDNEHPTIAGTYLAACVLYCTLAERPLNSARLYTPVGLRGGAATAMAIADAAWEAVFQEVTG